MLVLRLAFTNLTKRLLWIFKLLCGGEWVFFLKGMFASSCIIIIGDASAEIFKKSLYVLQTSPRGFYEFLSCFVYGGGGGVFIFLKGTFAGSCIIGDVSADL